MRQFVLSQLLFVYNFVVIWSCILLALPIVLWRAQWSQQLARWVGLRGINAARWMTGAEYEVRGQVHLPTGACLIAAKHQSAWETGALLVYVPNIAFIVRREFFYFTPIGWLCWRAKMLGVNRTGQATSLRKIMRRSAELIRANRPVAIFPEGTRRPVGAPPAYKSGVAGLYKSLGVPCVPVALNSGICWPRNALIKRRGKIILEFLPPIAPGLERKAFMARLEHDIETHSNRLAAEGHAAQKG